jgi:maltose alpha-D-glucosyltransferase / alpha-amylase
MNVELLQRTSETVVHAADWYKDAVIYQLHVKAFQDSDGDGMGDFKGLMQRLDHVQELGATAVWLLPFYPSPLRDDGYDIAEYKEINPSYGTMDDFQGFVDEAHRRGLKVITELVINHTSDQHPWFQRAREAPRGSPERDFYVWSDDPNKWPETRIIFTDTETSNWAWDPVAEQYYWHRFYSHQPDLNFDNPEVLRQVLDVMHFWLDKGVDGLRLDAIPYLVERDGTNNENLPETHEVLKAIRADLDAHYSDRMLLAEANQWPEDTRPYFGEGDECHMGFHFPLMPRMYMALAQEDRHAITDIIRQTPEIPPDCQWGIFLRNHDELTLEMVTDRERDYLWETYAADRRARINMGIRRRLAPLLQNDRRKIELLNFMLLSMPGTPIIYYGDEIAMGDNYYLGDRDGVRTPMQWSADRNAGFSKAIPQRLYLPTIQDPVYGFEAINVEAQQSSPSSLLNWMKRMIGVRQRHPLFGRGEIQLLYPRNRKVLAYVRRDGTESVLCVANLSRQAQAAEIDLSSFAGCVPVELTGRSAFPPVGELPYLLTLPAYGFYWFLLTDSEDAPAWHTPYTPVLPDFLTLTTRDGRLATALADRTGREFERQTLRDYLPLQRWFAGKGKRLGKITLNRLAELDGGAHLLSVVEVEVDGEQQRYFLPLSANWDEDASTLSPRLPATLAKLRRANRMGSILDGTADEGMANALLDRLRDEAEIEADGGRIAFRKSSRAGDLEAGSPRLLSAEQSNASIAFGDKIILKLYRRLRDGVQPDIEISRFLTEETDFDATPGLLGTFDWIADDGTHTTLGAVSEFLRNQGDAWTYVTEALDRDTERQDFLPDVDPDPEAEKEIALGGHLDIGTILGRRTAELHLALASGPQGSAFSEEPLTADDLARIATEAEADVTRALDTLASQAGQLPEDGQAATDRVLAARGDIIDRIASSAGLTPSGGKSRIHGDYHLGQVLVVQNDVAIIDFEGEPTRSLGERTAKTSPLRDVAGMLRSFDYALWTTVLHRIELGADPASTAEAVEGWRADTQGAFLNTYRERMADSSLHPSDPEFERRLLDLFLIQKAAYEIGYELAMRPDWVKIPLEGLMSLLAPETGATP